MNKLIQYNRTAVDSAALSVTTEALNQSGFIVESSTPSEIRLANASSPLGRKEFARISVNTVKDMYSSLGIEKSLYLPTRSGVNVYVQDNQIWSLVPEDSDTCCTDYEALVPISVGISIKAPDNPFVTDSDIAARALLRTMQWFSNGGDTFAPRIGELLRGVKTPSVLR